MSFPFRALQFSDRAVVSDEELLARVGRAGPGFAVVLRDAELSTGEQLACGRALRAATRAVGAGLVIADRLDVALLLDADGVHLGRASVTIADARAIVGRRLVTCSAHDVDEAIRAARHGADAVTLSPIFASPGKGGPLGTSALREARRGMAEGVALIALGGVTAGTLAACFDAGADAVAAIRADLSGLGR